VEYKSLPQRILCQTTHLGLLFESYAFYFFIFIVFKLT